MTQRGTHHVLLQILDSEGSARLHLVVPSVSMAKIERYRGLHELINMWSNRHLI